MDGGGRGGGGGGVGEGCRHLEDLGCWILGRRSICGSWCIGMCGAVGQRGRCVSFVHIYIYIYNYPSICRLSIEIFECYEIKTAD